jgi:hypothetical protein
MGVDMRWAAHLAYLRDLQRVGRELLAEAHARGPQPTESGSGCSARTP